MGALSTKDKLKLKLSAARVERWNRERCKSANNDVKRGEFLVLNLVNGKAMPKPTPEYDGKDVVPSHNVPCNPKAYSQRVSRLDNCMDYADSNYSESPRDPVRPKAVYRARPDSPFKRAGKAAASVVIVRK